MGIKSFNLFIWVLTYVFCFYKQIQRYKQIHDPSKEPEKLGGILLVLGILCIIDIIVLGVAHFYRLSGYLEGDLYHILDSCQTIGLFIIYFILLIKKKSIYFPIMLLGQLTFVVPVMFVLKKWILFAETITIQMYVVPLLYTLYYCKSKRVERTLTQ